MKTVRMTMAQALVQFIDKQFIELDGVEHKFVQGMFGIFGHGNVTGLGEALAYTDNDITFIQGHNEQGMVHAATAYAKQRNRLGIYACTTSVGPGALNLVPGAATATSNRIPVLLLPGDTFASRQPDPVLQQIEVPGDFTVTANDALRPVCKYWDRVNRPEQLITALLNAFRVLTDPVDTGAVAVCLPQDVQAEAYDYPMEFFDKRVWHLDRRSLSAREVKTAAEVFSEARRPVIICGGGVQYSQACEVIRDFAEEFKIPVSETQAGKSSLPWNHPLNVGGSGVTGAESANLLLRDADLILAVGSRLSDFTTLSKRHFGAENSKIFCLNVSSFDGHKLGAELLQGDAKIGLLQLGEALRSSGYATADSYQLQVAEAKQRWDAEVDRLYADKCEKGNCQTNVLGVVNKAIADNDTIICAAGSLPGDLQRLWRCKTPGSYHLEYAFSCMGYEVAAGLGVKLAKPDNEPWVIVGDGSYIMLHSELLTSIQEHQKINIILLDNHGYQCIKNLQMSQGAEHFGNERRFRQPETNLLDGEIVKVDFCKYAEALGAKTFFARNADELAKCIEAAKAETVSTLIEIKVEPGTMSNGYESWWRVGVAETSEREEIRKASAVMQQAVSETRKF
ncbi:3D-(3,5/4)-trihydroxycyclohexane-1,2-dione acylhydrolase (decyclizing) [Lentisphaerota bacterium ZTH]|nr:3D-(3,5/4)-trihydroxycyclohexane-1,2-dione acylhydrolase (decyclizing) [Lentisphaerota bacterium]WET07534.1 3D-(3,5/4)-trihydroxycyclohexane-1,2-dione acylhydrolase (decyclizing) [Lentisphaerota bacterium ZTH]